MSKYAGIYLVLFVCGLPAMIISTIVILVQLYVIFQDDWVCAPFALCVAMASVARMSLFMLNDMPSLWKKIRATKEAKCTTS